MQLLLFKPKNIYRYAIINLYSKECACEFYISKSVYSCTEFIQTHLPHMSPHLLHLVSLSNPDELYDLHLKLILLPHDNLVGLNFETVHLH